MTRKTWFTSDTHFGHARIAEFCPQRQEWFGMSGPDDIETMNEGLVAAWNAQVAPGDVVYHMGDFAMGQIDQSLAYAGRLNGYICMMLGNHDRPSPLYSKDPDKREAWAQRYYDAGIHTMDVGPARMSAEDQMFMMHHFPYYGDSHEEDRYVDARPEDHGDVLVHGHVHDMWQVNGRQINVGFDAWGRLLSEAEVAEMVRQARTSS